MSDLVKRLRRYSCSEHGTDFALGSGCISCESAAETHEAADRIESLEADHEKAVALVIAASIATGHADTSADLMAEVLHKVGELREKLEKLEEELSLWREYYRQPPQEE